MDSYNHTYVVVRTQTFMVRAMDEDEAIDYATELTDEPVSETWQAERVD